jgi:lipopolysaccharide heptosyltransferase II
MRNICTPRLNILIIKPGAVGDLLQMTPVVRALKQYSPSAKITMLVGTGAAAALFQNNPHVFETLVSDRSGDQQSLRAMLNLWRELRGKHYDLVLNFQRSNLRAWFLASAALPSPVLVYHRARNRTVHAVVNYLETLAPLGISAAVQELELFLDDGSRTYARELFSSLGPGNMPLIALNPGATHGVNRWPAVRFAELADMLLDNRLGKTVIVGGPDDVPLAEEIRALSRTKPLSIAGRTSLLQLGAVLEKCSVLVSGDTGPLHMATAVGTKVVALFGAADPTRTGPVGSGHRIIHAAGVACVPCRSRTCSNSAYLECMQKITAKEVVDAVAGMLKGG